MCRGMVIQSRACTHAQKHTPACVNLVSQKGGFTNQCRKHGLSVNSVGRTDFPLKNIKLVPDFTSVTKKNKTKATCEKKCLQNIFTALEHRKEFSKF